MQGGYGSNLDLMTRVKGLSLDGTNEITYTTWFENLELKGVEGDVVTLIVPDAFYQQNIKKYDNLLNNCFKIALDTKKDFKIEYVTKDNVGEVHSDYNKHLASNVDPRFTFNNFVIGDNNRFAQAAAYAVSEAPGMYYNPLFIYGNVGLGKTHLAHAIGNEIFNRYPDKKVTYVTSEKFTNEFINGIKDKTNEEFRAKYRNIDVLIIDDIQFIAGKEGIQEEFFHTFNSICENKGQLVIISDKPPKDINPLEERLKSRFNCGLLVDISDANYETRLAILRKKVQIENIVIDDLVLSDIATKIDTNVRDLEGALKKIVALASLTHSPITLDFAEKAVADIMANREKVISPEYIKEKVCKYFNIPIDDIDSAKRSSNVAGPRQIAMYLCRDLAKMQYKTIGNSFGNRDHSTVMHACNKIEQDLKIDYELRGHVDKVKNIILAPQP